MKPVLVGSSRHASGVAVSLRRALSARGVPCTLSSAQETVARMFGHRDWHGLRAASKGRPPTPDDEAAGPAEAAARRGRQAVVLTEAYGLPAAAAMAIVDAVRPTGRRGADAVPRTTFQALESALRGKARLRAFLSGGGLRVIRVEKGERLVGYGEAPTMAPALALAEDDVAAGGRPYGEVYGKLVPEYLTGDVGVEADPVDVWIYEGHKLAVAFERGRFVATLTAIRLAGASEEVLAEARTTGRPVTWEERGMRYVSTPYGDGTVSTRCVDEGDGSRRDQWSFHASRTGAGEGIAEALAAALAAPEVALD